MKNTILSVLCVAALAISSCSKDNKPNTPVVTDGTTEAAVITQFASVVANPNYAEIQANAGIMKDAAATLIATPNDANLEATRTAWKNTRATWESCEGYLFGPVEDNNYDPTMDDWPVNKVDLDSLIKSKNPLTVSDIDPLATTLKGFHAIEYIIFGVGGTKKASQITAREKQYLSSLTESLYNTTTALKNSWDPASGNYTAQVTSAGSGSTVFASKKDFFITLISSMSGICDEVANGKMQEPFAARDSTLDESSFSHNSTTDFTNNITGVLNVYLCKYKAGTGTASLSSLVAAKNLSLDTKIQTQLNTAIASFSNITVSYEKAIYTQRAQIQATQKAILALQTTLDSELTDFIQANVKD